MKHLAILISLIILKSCGSSNDIASLNKSTDMITNEIIKGTYVLEQLDTIEVTNDKLTLEFDSKTNRVSGFAGCNRFFGTYTTNGNTISFSELGATRMICQEEVNKKEHLFFQTMTKVNAFELSNGELSLKKNETVLISATKNKTSQLRQAETKINILYRASTRGFFEAIWIEGNVLKYTKDRNLKETSIYKLSEEQLSELMSLYNDLDVESIPSIKPPSKTFLHDAAAMATLTIVLNEKEYVSNGFDHGNPPKTFALFVDKVLSVKETMVKQ